MDRRAPEPAHHGRDRLWVIRDSRAKLDMGSAVVPRRGDRFRPSNLDDHTARIRHRRPHVRA
jgi:hypothetical protein